MDYFQVMALTTAIVTSQGAIWRPVTVQTINEPEQVVYSTPAGSVTQEYKPTPKRPQKCDRDSSLRCWFADFE